MVTTPPTWYALVRENPPDKIRPTCGCGCNKPLTKEEIEGNRNLPVLIHWDRSQLQETNGYYIVPVQPAGQLK